jgi:hypothetical protein
VAEHLRSCLGCARALRAHQQALAAFRSLREMESAPARRAEVAERSSAGGGSVLWERLKLQMHEAPAAPLTGPSWSRRILELGARVPQRWRVALAAGLLGASLLALGLKLADRLAGDAPSRGTGAAPLQVSSDERGLQDAGVLDPARAGGARLPHVDRAPQGRQTQFVGRVGPNSNY